MQPRRAADALGRLVRLGGLLLRLGGRRRDHDGSGRHHWHHVDGRGLTGLLRRDVLVRAGVAVLARRSAVLPAVLDLGTVRVGAGHALFRAGVHHGAAHRGLAGRLTRDRGDTRGGDHLGFLAADVLWPLVLDVDGQDEGAGLAVLLGEGEGHERPPLLLLRVGDRAGARQLTGRQGHEGPVHDGRTVLRALVLEAQQQGIDHRRVLRVLVGHVDDRLAVRVRDDLAILVEPVGEPRRTQTLGLGLREHVAKPRVAVDDRHAVDGGVRVDQGLGVGVAEGGVGADLVERLTEAPVVVCGHERRRHGVGPQPARRPHLDERLAHVELALALGGVGDEAVGTDGQVDNRLVPVEPAERVGPLGPSRREVRGQERANDQRAYRSPIDEGLLEGSADPSDETQGNEGDEDDGQPDRCDPAESQEQHQGAQEDAHGAEPDARDDGTRHQREDDEPPTGDDPGGPLRHEIHHASFPLVVGVSDERDPPAGADGGGRGTDGARTRPVPGLVVAVPERGHDTAASRLRVVRVHGGRGVDAGGLAADGDATPEIAGVGDLMD